MSALAREPRDWRGLDGIQSRRRFVRVCVVHLEPIRETPAGRMTCPIGHEVDEDSFIARHSEPRTTRFNRLAEAILALPPGASDAAVRQLVEDDLRNHSVAALRGLREVRRRGRAR